MQCLMVLVLFHNYTAKHFLFKKQGVVSCNYLVVVVCYGILVSHLWRVFNPLALIEIYNWILLWDCWQVDGCNYDSAVGYLVNFLDFSASPVTFP